MNIPEYNITLKVRNNLLLQSFKDAGETVGPALANKIGIHYTTLCRYISLKTSPIDKDGEYKDAVYKICDYLNKFPSDLWTEEQLTPLEKSTVEFTTTYDQMISYLPNGDDATLVIENEEFMNDMTVFLDSLPPRYKQVIDLRFGLTGNEHNYREIGEILGITRERVRQMEAKALRKLRHPKISADMQKYVDPNYVEKRIENEQV